MLAKHLCTGLIVGFFALALGFDPVAVESGVAAADQPPQKVVHKEKDSDDKKVDRAPKDTVTASNKDGDRAKDQDKPTEDSWARRLVFPSGSKF
jgi:hypothetical protein